jgi:hypothetical protein
MSLDISPLEQAVPRATALLKRLSSVQAEAFASQSGGPDIQAMTERMRAASKSAGVLATGSGTARFKTPEAERAFVDPISQANEESLIRRAKREKAFRDEQANAIAKIAADEKSYALAAEQAEARRLEILRAREAYEQSIYDQKLRQAAVDNASATQELSAIRNKASASAAAFIAEERAQQELADIRRQQAQVRATGEYSRANPFQQQVLAVQRLNQLLAERRRLLGNGDDVAIARATLAVNRQVQAVRNLRDELTVGTEGFRRLGNTSADSLGGYARFGLAAQQVGYQVQDFAVQVTSGTNAMVAFSQQASQLLGFFGGFKGALAGAALAIGILVYRLSTGEEFAKKQAEAIDTLTEAFKRLRDSNTDLSRRNLSQPQMVEILTKDAEAAKKAALDASNAVTQARNRISEVDFPEVSQSVVKGGSIFGENLPYLVKYFTLFVTGTTNAQVGTEQHTEASKRLSEALADQTQKTDAATRAKEEYDRAFKQAKEEGADAGRTDLQRIAFLKQQQAEAEKLGQQETVEYQTRKNQIRELERTQRASLDRLSRDRELIGKDEFDKLAIYRREWLKSEEGSVAEAEALNRVKEQEAALKKTADAYKDQLDPLRAQKRELETINGLIAENLLTQQEADMLRLRMQDERERTLRTPEALRIDTGASFAGMRNTDQSATTLISIQQQMLAALKTLVFQGAN